MGRFTRIPEINLAGTLGGFIGQTTGTVISNANLTIEKLQNRLNEICEQLSEGKQIIYSELEYLEKTVDSVEGTLVKVEKAVEDLNKTAELIKIPVTSLRVSVNIIKYLPLPQMYLLTSVSALHSDTIQMISETIAQLEQTTLTLKTVISIILDLIKKLKDLLTNFRKTITALKASLSVQKANLSSQDVEILKNIGILDRDNNNIFTQITPLVNSSVMGIIWLGEYTGIDTGSIVVQNQVKAANPGTTINVSVSSVGNWITTVYTLSDNKPKQPSGQELVPEGWTDTVDLSKGIGWSSKGTVLGLTNKVLSWTEPVRCSELKQPRVFQINPATKPVNVFRLDSKSISIMDFNMQEANAVILSNSEEAYKLLLSLLQKIDNTPVSQSLKDQLRVEINPQENQLEMENTEEWYISKKTGDMYKMVLKSSSVSPKIATLRYIQVIDKSGTVVYEGTETFATDPKILFEETRVRLTQLLG